MITTLTITITHDRSRSERMDKLFRAIVDIIEYALVATISYSWRNE